MNESLDLVEDATTSPTTFTTSPSSSSPENASDDDTTVFMSETEALELKPEYQLPSEQCSDNSDIALASSEEEEGGEDEDENKENGGHEVGEVAALGKGRKTRRNKQAGNAKAGLSSSTQGKNQYPGRSEMSWYEETHHHRTRSANKALPQVLQEAGSSTRQSTRVTRRTNQRRSD